jgi:ABC-type phosphate/phosphonate transport system substrate-binding protein
MTTPFAALPMYDWPEVSGSWDELWAIMQPELVARGIDAGEALSRAPDHEAQWNDPQLVLGQTCGWPYISVLRGKVAPVARFDFGLGGRPGDYHSVYIAASERDPADILADDAAIIATNAFNSQSGFRALSQLSGSPTAVPASRFLVTGGHRNSIKAVAGGRAQLAAIDAQSWRLALAHEPAAAKVRVAGRSSDVPGLPLITAPAFSRSTAQIFAALQGAIESLPRNGREALCIAGLVPARPEDYEVLTRPPFGLLSVIP